MYFTQDLIYSGTHLYLTKHMEHWIRVLQEMLMADYELFMPGHGLPADKNEVARNIEYLSAARQAIGNGLADDAFKDFMLQQISRTQMSGDIRHISAPAVRRCERLLIIGTVPLRVQ